MGRHTDRHEEIFVKASFLLRGLVVVVDIRERGKGWGYGAVGAGA